MSSRERNPREIIQVLKGFYFFLFIKLIIVIPRSKWQQAHHTFDLDRYTLGGNGQSRSLGFSFREKSTLNL